MLSSYGQNTWGMNMTRHAGEAEEGFLPAAQTSSLFPLLQYQLQLHWCKTLKRREWTSEWFCYLLYLTDEADTFSEDDFQCVSHLHPHLFTWKILTNAALSAVRQYLSNASFLDCLWVDHRLTAEDVVLLQSTTSVLTNNIWWLLKKPHLR